MQSRTREPLTIRREMFLLGFLFLIAVSFLYAGIFLRLLYQNNIRSARNSLRECNSQMVIYTEGMFHENATVVELLARNGTIINAGYGDVRAVTAIFWPLLKTNSNITYIYSGYADGRLLIDNYDTPLEFNPTERPWYQAAAASDGVARLVYADAATGEWLFSQCMRLNDRHGNMVGAVAIDCSNESISNQLSTKYQYRSQRSFIVDQNGTVLIHPNEQEINSSIRDKLDVAVWNGIVDGRNNYGEYRKDGVAAMAYFERIPKTDFFVVTAIDAAEVTGPIVRNTLFLMAATAGISILLGYFLSRLLIHRFARPIIELGGRIQNLAAGRPGKERAVRFSNAEINGIAESIEIIVKDIATREEQRKAAEYLSFHDSMTGLYNRRFFEEELRRLDVKRNYPLCLVCCDVNGLKLVNDVFGHAMGDLLLTTVARCMERGCRADDILARIGGDEFAVILPHTSASDAQQVLMRIRASFPEDSVCGVEVSASLGYAVKNNRDQPLDEVLRAADEMMYECKTMESVEMKRRTVEHIIAAAEQEGLVRPTSPREAGLLDAFAKALCPELCSLLRDSYRLRKIGLCTLVPSVEETGAALSKHHTEVGYRILSALEEYRSVAGCVLHSMEHWDGSGWPAGLSGRDIPLLSRIIAVVAVYCEQGSDRLLLERSGTWYDPDLVRTLSKLAAEHRPV